MVTSWSSVRFLMWCSLPCPSLTHQRFTDRPCRRHRNGPAQENSILTGCMQTSSHSVDSLFYCSILLVFVLCVVCLCRNNNSVESLSRLVIHAHQGSIYSACFSHDGSKIASSGASKTLKVFTVPLSHFSFLFICTYCHVTILSSGI